MRTLLKIWLMLGLIWPAPCAFAEDPPTKAELERLKAWNDLYLSPNPVYQDSEKQFLQGRFFTTEESRARDAFYRLPQTKAILEEGRKDISAFLDKTAAEAAKSFPALGREIPLEPGSEMLHSFQEFWRKNLRKKNSMTEAEAERLARYQLEQRYGRLDLQDFNQRREFQRETNRFLMSSEGKRALPRLTESDFQEWKASEIQRLKGAREANMESLARFSVELSPGDMRLAKATAEGVISFPSERALTAADLDGAKFTYRPITLRPRDYIGLESQKKGVVSWFVRLKSGEEFAISHRNGSHVQRVLPNSAAMQFSENDFFRASKPEQEKIFAYYAAAHAEEAFSEMGERVRDKIRYQPDPRELESLISAHAKEINSVKARLTGAMKWESQILFARGLMKDPDFWKKRDAQAKALGLGKFPLGKDDPPKQGLFHGWARHGGDRGGGSLLSGPRSSLSLNGAPSRAENTAKEVQQAADKNILFKTNKIIPGRGPSFYALFDSTKVAEAEKVAPLGGRSALTVSSAQPFQPRAGLVAIPSPAGHDLADIELVDASGKRLEAGRDFKILKGKDGYALEMAASDGLYNFRAGFSPKKEASAPEFFPLSKEKLASIQKGLSAAKLDALAQGLSDLLQKEKVSLRDLEALFRKESLYSYNPEPDIQAKVKEASGPFADFARFADAEGRACFQCDGSNSLFRRLLEEYFDGHAEVRNVSGFQSPYRSLKESHLHLITKLEVPGYAPFTLDATPVRMDRAAPGGAERVIAQSTKIAAEPPRPKPVYVENFRRELADSKAKFLKVAEPARLSFNKGDPWLNVGKATAVLDEYLEGSRSLEEAGEELKKFFPGRAIASGTHDEFMRSLSAVAREERATLAKAARFAKENPHVPGGGGYQNTAVVNATDRRLEILSRAEEMVSAENFSQYRATRLAPPGNCREMFGALGK